jgi:hypothetical protein
VNSLPCCSLQEPVCFSMACSVIFLRTIGAKIIFEGSSTEFSHKSTFPRVPHALQVKKSTRLRRRLLELEHCPRRCSPWGASVLLAALPLVIAFCRLIGFVASLFAWNLVSLGLSFLLRPSLGWGPSSVVSDYHWVPPSFGPAARGRLLRMCFQLPKPRNLNNHILRRPDGR